jgi:hypothetical protein
MKELHNELYAVDGEDLVELFDLIAPGGTLYVHNVSVFATQPLVVTGPLRSLDMYNSRLDYWGDTLPFITIKDTGNTPHRIIDCYFHFNHTAPTVLVETDSGDEFEQEYKDLDVEYGDPYDEDEDEDD